MDIISRRPGCAGQTADAISAVTQVKVEDAPTLLKIPKSECPDIWIRLPKHKRPKSWSSMEDPVVPQERNLCGHPSPGLPWERQFEKSLLEHRWEMGESFQLSMLIRAPRNRTFLICACGWHQIGWKETKYWSDVDNTHERSWFGRTNIIPWPCLFGCTQRECKASKDIVDC